MKALANLAALDRVLRLAGGVAMLYLGWSELLHGVPAIALAVFAWFPLLTGLLGWCPVYALLGFSTRRGPGRGH